MKIDFDTNELLAKFDKTLGVVNKLGELIDHLNKISDKQGILKLIKENKIIGSK